MAGPYLGGWSALSVGPPTGERWGPSMRSFVSSVTIHADSHGGIATGLNRFPRVVPSKWHRL
eukprot:7887434-Pyramimonas_sp.AAC.2